MPVSRRTLISSLLLLGAARPGRAAPVSHRIRLLGGEFRDGAWLAGLDLAFDEGWKTYWRMPGDSGVPPSFDWSPSVNVAKVEVLWPAPRRYHDAAGETVGYTERVVFPLLVTPADADEPVDLALKIFFAVCKDICIPANAIVSTRLEADPAAASLIAAFAARVPKPGEPFRAARVVVGREGPALWLETNPGWDAAGMDVFVEGFEAASFRAPRAAGGGYSRPIDGLKDVSALKGAPLTLTLVTDHIQLEQRLTVE